MKSIYLLVFVLFVCSLNAEYSSNQIIVKFKSDSPEFSIWLSGNRLGQIESLKSILGNHRTTPFISSIGLLKSKNKTIDEPLSSSGISSPLLRIAVVEYENDIDPVLISRKISSLPFIEYAEPKPVHRFFGEPNDPKRNGQYYLDSIHVYEAWDLIDTTQTVIIAIVDTGIDYDHEDLAGNIYINPGEDGIDSLGGNKRDNGVDDDGNGYIDDWRGWDFDSADSSGQDNDPHPGHQHGTHVGGTAGAVTNNALGIASVGRFIRLMPVKAASDNPLSTSVNNGYEGILYAAVTGAQVINCSWGSNTRSQAEQELIDEAVSYGAVIVGASGNSSRHEAFYPAAYKGVISVAGLNSINEKAYFSNYDESVDVSAPGEDILATVPNDSYDFMDGTSMASPIVAGVAALALMAQPEYSPKQIKELLRVTCDDISEINPAYKGLIGKGKINALKVVSSKNPRSVRMLSYNVFDENNDGVLDPGEKVEISTSYENILSDVKQVRVKGYPDSFFLITIEQDSLYLGNMKSGDSVNAVERMFFTIPEDVVYDFEFKIKFDIIDSIGLINTESITLYANPSYRNLDKNNITTTINSRGNIGFNDYSSNLQGIGWKYKGSQNINFEGALLTGSGYSRISDVSRGLNQSYANRDFVSTNYLKIEEPGEKAAIEAFAEYGDNNDSSKAGLFVKQHVYQFTETGANDIILSSYDVVNHSGVFLDSVYVGLFFDWDIGPSGANNQVHYNPQNFFGYIRHVSDNSLPMAGVRIVTPNKLNFHAIDNGGSSEENSINIYNGFARREKWQAMSSGISRRQSGVTDASMVIAAGPISMMAGDTTRVTFAIFSGMTVEEMNINAVEAKQLADKYGLSGSNYPVVPKGNTITSVYPSPAPRGVINIDYTIVEQSDVSIELYDSIGRLTSVPMPNQRIEQGRYSMDIDTKKLSSGIYYLLLKTSINTQFAGFSIIN